MDVDGSGQLVGSESEIASILQLALQHFPGAKLVFDGVDECTDPPAFLEKLYAICGNSTCQIVLLSRPNLHLPPPYQIGRFHIHLGLVANLNDIQEFLSPHVEDLLATNLLPRSFSHEDVVWKIATRANSLFLWAKLMASYLKCPALSPRDRAEAIDNLNLLEGLDTMYSKILNVLRKRLLPERQTAFKVFQWLVAVRRPLKLSEMRAALAIRYQQPSTSDLDYIVDFVQSLVLICGALVEVRETGYVQFIHLSVNEFLTSKEVQSSEYPAGDFHINIPAAHLSIASYSLSYLSYDVPGSPLSGSSKVAADKTYLKRRYPLLEYALLLWHHAVDGLAVDTEDVTQDFKQACSIFLSMATSFLSAKTAVTLWIEASWTFSEAPHLNGLTEQLILQQEKLCKASKALNSTVAEFDTMRKSFESLSNDLEYLSKEWRDVLLRQPNEVWEPSINMFRQSPFLIGTNAAKISWVAETVPHTCNTFSKDDNFQGTPWNCEDGNSMVLASQVSMDGSRLGSITMSPPQ